MARRVPQIAKDIRYARDRARGVMSREGIRPGAYVTYGSVTGIARAIAADQHLASMVRRRIAQLGVAAGGRISGIGRGVHSPFELNNFPLLVDCAPLHVTGGWLNKELGGIQILWQLATAALIGAIALNIDEDLRKEEYRTGSPD